MSVTVVVADDHPLVRQGVRRLLEREEFERICAEVRTRGVERVFHYTEQFDRVRLNPDTLRVTRSEMALAHAAADKQLMETVRRVRQNVLAFQLGLLHRDAGRSRTLGER